MTQLFFVVCVALAGGRDLPAGLATSLHDSTAALTSIVVTDIDRDGDADVVATDGALHLFVWINDGTGRLTRQAPAPPHEGRTAAPPRGVERGGPTPDPSTPTDPPSLDPHAAVSASISLEWRRAPRLASTIRRDEPRATRPQRGPPAGSSLL